MTPTVSVIIVNFNGKRWLTDLLPDISKQDYKKLEVILVDNGSKDDSVTFIKRSFPKIKLIELKKNLGFAIANNIGYAQSRGDYILLLNNDIRVNKTFVSLFTKAFTEIPSCSIAQSKIVYLNNRGLIDSCGSYFTDTTFQYYYGNDKSSDNLKYNKEVKIFSTKGASMIIKREVIKKIGLFDPSYWSYYEETDFCHRAWLAGFEVWYWPKAVAAHAVGGTSTTFSNSFVQFHNYKNKLSSLLVNLDPVSLVKYIPRYLFWIFVIMTLWIFNGKIKHSLMLGNSVVWVIKNLSSIMTKRSKIQKIRLVPDLQIFKMVLRNPYPKYYSLLFKNKLSQYED